MLKVFAILFGLVMFAFGILGFLPDYAPNGLLFGVFSVNPVHNLVHLLTGLIAIICGLASSLAAKFFFIVIGVAYTGLAVLGFMQGEGVLYGLIAINMADNWLHVGLAALSFVLGLFVEK